MKVSNRKLEVFSDPTEGDSQPEDWKFCSH